MESSSSSKKAKGYENNRQVASCVVDGCCSDLSECREYHRRHKVCEPHSKAPTVTIGGREQRFCQQCSRFHSLGEFDDWRRSCRKRLDGHNRRRRKPPSESLTKTHGGSSLSNEQGTTLLSFRTTTSQPLPNTMVNSSWAGPHEMDQINVLGPYYCYNNDNATETLNHHHSFGEVNHFKMEPPVHGSSIGYDTTRVVDSDCALSLLSSGTTAETRAVGLGHSLVPRVQYFEELMSFSYDAHHCETHGLFPDGPKGSGH